MKRAVPHLLFAAVTLAVFWKALFLDWTLYPTEFIEARTGAAPPAVRTHVGVADSVLLLPTLLRIYNEGLKEGELRLWNPTLFCGTPIYADPMVHPFYPPHLALHFAFGPEGAYTLSLMLHFFFSGVAMYALGRGLKRSAAASTAGGLLWMLSGYGAVWFNTGILLGASVFAPLALLWIERGLDERRTDLAAWAAAAMGMTILGSHPQHALHVFLFLVCWMAARRAPLRFSLTFALLSLGIGLAELLPRLDTIANGFRRGDAAFDAFYDRPGVILTHLAGLVSAKVYFPSDGALEYEFTCYAGAAGLTLAIAGAARGFREGPARLAAILGVAALLVAFVKPLASLVHLVPILHLSPPSRWIPVAGLCAALLAARGWDALAERPGRTGWILGGLAAACALAFRSAAGLETAAGLALAAGGAFAAARRPRAALGLGFAALLMDLLPFFMIFNAPSDPAPLRRTPAAIEEMRRRDPGPWRALGTIGVVDADPLEMGHGCNLLALYGVETAGGFEAVAPAHYVQYALAAGAWVSTAGRQVAFSRFDSRLLDGAGVKYLLLPADVAPGPRFRLLGRFGKMTLHENPHALPRAYTAENVVQGRDEAEAMQVLNSPGFDPARVTVLTADSPLPCAPGKTQWVERTSDRQVLEVELRGRGILVVSETDYPGWEATVDGKPVPILRANGAFRAVEVPEGRHRVEFRFRPPSVRQGIPGSLAFAILALLAAWRYRPAKVSASQKPRHLGLTAT